MGSAAAPIYLQVVPATAAPGQLQLAHSQQDLYILQFYRDLIIPASHRPKYDHNLALKALRYMYEDKTNPFESLPVQCKSDGDWLVRCDHAAKGMNFSFDDQQKWMWQWTLMVAQLQKMTATPFKDLGSNLRKTKNK